jgi:uncharacterized protein (TIGR02266 family)
MSPDPDTPSKTDLERQRVPLERKISLKFKEFRGFITEYSSNLSLGGMFIRTTSPKPIGTIFDFELSLTDDFKLVQGIGEVMWIRADEGGPERPAGMGVRFLDLSPDSRKLIQRIVDEHVEHGGVPFELEAPTFPPPARPAPPAAPTAGPRTVATPPPVFHATAAPMVAPAPPAASPPTSSAAPGDTTRRLPTGALHPASGAVAPGSSAGPVLPPSTRDTAADAVGHVPESPVTATPPEAMDLEPLGPSLDLDLADLGSPDLGSPDLGDDSTELLPTGDHWRADEVEALPLPADELPPGRALGRPAEGGAILPAGFDEVARAFASTSETVDRDEVAGAATDRSPSLDVFGRPSPWVTPPSPATESRSSRVAPNLLDDETVRLERSPAPASPFSPPPELPDVQLPLSGQEVGTAAPRAAATASAPPLAFPQPARRPPPARRRSVALPVAAALALLLVGGATAVYFAFPHLLPAWVPRATDEPLGAAPAAGPLADLTAPRAGEPAGGPGEASTDASADLAVADPGAAPPAAAGPIGAGEIGDPAPADAIAGPSGRGGSRGLDHQARFSSVDEIWGQQTASGTVVTLVADGAVPEGAYTTFRLEGGNPREVLRLRGVASRFSRPTLPIATSEVRQVRVGYHEKPEGNELHVVIDLTSARVRLVRVVASDNRLELLLAPL